MNYRCNRSLLVAVAVLLAAAPPSFAQGKGNDKGKHDDRGKPAKVQEEGNDHRADKAGKGKHSAAKKVERSNTGYAKFDRAVNGNGKARKFERSFAARDLEPNLRKFAVSKRAPERIAAGVISRGHARGLDNDDVVIHQNGDRVVLLNRSGVLLVDLDDDRARDLGNWRVRPYDDDVQRNAPAFCRSGEGHPVFGREWCLQKGFGLGDYRDLRWGRTTDVGDIIFQRQVDRGTLARAVLIDVLGDVVFNRLGLHALTLGYSDPLTGTWLGEPAGPQVLRVTSGGYPIAEIYDGDRDNRADALVVALRPWY